MQSWLEGRIWVGKCAEATGMTARLRILSSKADSNTWESFTRSELKLESVHQESPRSDIFRKRATEPLLKQRHRQKHLTWAMEKKNWTVAQWSKVLFSDESKFSISFGNQCPRVWRKRGEAQNPCCFKSRVKFPQSVMIWAAMSSAGVGPLCFLKFTVNTDIFRTFENTSCFLLLTSFMEMQISFSSRTWHLHTLPKVPKAGSVTMLLLCLIDQQTRLTWTPSRIYDERHQTQQYRWLEGCYQINLGFITPEQCHGLIVFMPRRIDAVIHAKGGPFVIPVILFRSLTFLFKIYFFYCSYVIFTFSETLNFAFSLSVSHNPKISRNKSLKYFTLCVMNLYNIWVSLSEMSDKNLDLFHDIIFFF